MKSRLNVLYQSSSMYAPVAATSIYSLLVNNRMIDELVIYYLDGGLTEDDKR